MSCQTNMADVVGGRAGAERWSPRSATDKFSTHGGTQLEGHNRSGDGRIQCTNTHLNPSHQNCHPLFLARGSIKVLVSIAARAGR